MPTTRAGIAHGITSKGFILVNHRSGKFNSSASPRLVNEMISKDEKVKTTETKAKAVKPIIDRLISRAKKKDKINAIRYLNAKLPDPLASKKIIDVLLDKYKERPSGYTRIIKTGFRRGDAAPMVKIELV